MGNDSVYPDGMSNVLYHSANISIKASTEENKSVGVTR
jgi:hypothetical protein